MRQSKKIAVSMLALSVVSMYGCGKKDITVTPHVVWIMAKPVASKDKSELFKKELVDWYVPFKDDAACPNVQFFPEVEVIRLDGSEEVREVLAVTEPNSLAKKGPNFVEKLFGTKLKFEQLIELARAKLQATEPPDKLMQPMGNGRDVDARLWNVISQKTSSSLIASREEKAQADAMLSKLKVANSENAKLFVHVGDQPEVFRAALAKQLCDSAIKKQPLKPVFLIDVRTKESGIAIAPPQPEPLVIPTFEVSAISTVPVIEKTIIHQSCSIPVTHPTKTITPINKKADDLCGEPKPHVDPKPKPVPKPIPTLNPDPDPVPEPITKPSAMKKL